MTTREKAIEEVAKTRTPRRWGTEEVGEESAAVIVDRLIAAGLLQVWRPIEEAAEQKKSGEFVWLFGRDMYGVNDPRGPASRMDKGWFEEGRWIGLGTHFPPTHFMPFPAPPAQEK